MVGCRAAEHTMEIGERVYCLSLKLRHCFPRFEKVYTHTLYYLAQVYQHLEMTEKAAQYCHTTLKRQLEYSGYYPIEWALNAAILSQYYLTKVIISVFSPAYLICQIKILK